MIGTRAMKLQPTRIRDCDIFVSVPFTKLSYYNGSIIIMARLGQPSKVGPNQLVAQIIYNTRSTVITHLISLYMRTRRSLCMYESYNGSVLIIYWMNPNDYKMLYQIDTFHKWHSRLFLNSNTWIKGTRSQTSQCQLR